MATLMLVLILPSESPSSGPSCELTHSQHFFIILFTAKAPMSLSFLSPSLIPPQDRSLHQVLRKRAGQGLPSSELQCWGSGRSPAEGPQLPGASNITVVQGSRTFFLSQEISNSAASHGFKGSFHFLVILLPSVKDSVSPSFLSLSSHPSPGGEEGSEDTNAAVPVQKQISVQQEDSVQMLHLDFLFKIGQSRI